MIMSKFLCLLFLLTSVVYGQNLLQICSSVLQTYNNNYYYYGSFAYNFDLGNASLPHNQGYTTTLPSGATVHFNVCAGTSLCDGNAACIVQNGIVLSYASATQAGYYQSSELYNYPYYTEVVQMRFYTTTGDQNTLLNVTCDPTIPPPNNQYFRVLGATLSGGTLTINATSYYACSSNYNIGYNAPTYYSSFAAPIYMQGRIPFFLQDVLSSSVTEFLGMLYYSKEYGVVINGTLTNTESGSSHFVAFYFIKDTTFNPPSMYNYVIHQGSSTAGCYLLGIPNDNDYGADWFSSLYNSATGLEREYTSIYFNKGSSFAVRTNTNMQYDNPLIISMLQRVSDGLPVFIGSPLLSPWAEYGSVGSYVSELNWENIESTTLGANTFQPPAAFGCVLA